MSDLDVSKFRDIFIVETEEHLGMLVGNLLKLEKIFKKNDPQKLGNEKRGAFKNLLDEMMRSSHTIKSSSATMGYEKMAYLTHVLEDVFDYARNDLLQIDTEIINDLFSSFDVLQDSLNQIKETGEEKNLDSFTEKIKNISGVSTEGVGKSQRDDSGKPLSQKSKKGEKNSQCDRENPLENLLKETQIKISHIRVPVERLDGLLDLAEELLIEKMRIENLVFRDESLKPLKPRAQHLGNIISELQTKVMQTRLVPVGEIFSRFPRMVRDLAEAEKKEIEFVIQGEELEVDRTIVDKLAEPLVHLLRNAVDHGIEKTGKIELSAKREKDNINISVADNGVGINWQSVLDSAEEKGIISSEDLALIENLEKNKREKDWQNQLERLLFHPRLSTKKEVTETSGRGIGLSVVKKFVDEINGEVALYSSAGEAGGTQFVLELPLTLAIINSLLVLVQNRIFAIPFSNIERVVEIPTKNIRSVGDQDVAVVDGKNVPLANLQKFFHLNLLGKINPPKEVSNPNKNSRTVVLVRKGRDIAGLVVDELIRREEIILKPLPRVLKGIPGFTGSTILGDGKTVLILDVSSVLNDTKKLLRI